jgi:hypothetical protein
VACEAAATESQQTELRTTVHMLIYYYQRLEQTLSVSVQTNPVA